MYFLRLFLFLLLVLVAFGHQSSGQESELPATKSGDTVVETESHRVASTESVGRDSITVAHKVNLRNLLEERLRQFQDAGGERTAVDGQPSRLPQESFRGGRRFDGHPPAFRNVSQMTQTRMHRYSNNPGHPRRPDSNKWIKSIKSEKVVNICRYVGVRIQKREDKKDKEDTSKPNFLYICRFFDIFNSFGFLVSCCLFFVFS